MHWTLSEEQEKNVCFKGQYQENKKNPLNRRKQLQVMYLIRYLYLEYIKNTYRGTSVAPSITHLTLAQVMISWLMDLSPTSDSKLTAQPGACFRFYVSLSLCPSHIHVLSLFLSKINEH